MGKLNSAVGILLIASCGRLGFSDESPTTTQPDAAMAPQGDGAVAQVLVCGSPTRFQVGAGSVTAMTATAMPNGFALFTVAGTNVDGWAYEFSGTQLVASAENVLLDNNANGTIGSASIGAKVVLASMYGMPATGTSLYPLSTTLTETGTPMPRAGQLAASNSIASNGDGTSFAFATVDATSHEVDARSVTAMGIDNGAVVQVVAGSETPGAVSLIAAATGYAVGYTNAAANPNADRIELLDDNLAVVAGPVTASTAAADAESMEIAWAPQTNLYLVTWHQKNATGDDDVWISILGPNLEAVTPPTLIASYSYSPQVASDGMGFWLTWRTYVNTPAPDFLQAAHVAPDGTVTLRAVSNSGGTPGQWAMTVRDAQPVLVWTETGGTGPDLYFDPMCSS